MRVHRGRRLALTFAILKLDGRVDRFFFFFFFYEALMYHQSILLYRSRLTSGGDIQVAASSRPSLVTGRSYALAGDRPGMFPPVILQPSRFSIGETSWRNTVAPTSRNRQRKTVDGTLHPTAARRHRTRSITIDPLIN